MNDLPDVEQQLRQQSDQQLSQTDPDARSMATSGWRTGIVGYNGQIATDTAHHRRARGAQRRPRLHGTVVHGQDGAGGTWMQGHRLIADQGYYKGPEILNSQRAGAQTLIPKPMTSGSKAYFVFDAKADVYRCPAGQILRRGPDSVEDGLTRHSYGCSNCPMKTECTLAGLLRISRWEHEDVLDAMQRRLDRNPNAMKICRCTVEHVFGTLKYWMGSTHFLMNTLKPVPTEISRLVFAYNLRCLLSLLGTAETMKAMRFARA